VGAGEVIQTNKAIADHKTSPTTTKRHPTEIAGFTPIGNNEFGRTQGTHINLKGVTDPKAVFELA